MSTNYTENFDLCQWEPTDPVLRTDFNADNAKIDAALGLVKGCNCHLYLKTHTGTGENGPVVHTFSHRPMAVMILSDNSDTRQFGIRGVGRLSGLAIGIEGGTTITWTDRSITIGSAESHPMYTCNLSGRTYSIAAFLDVQDA